MSNWWDQYVIPDAAPLTAQAAPPPSVMPAQAPPRAPAGPSVFAPPAAPAAPPSVFGGALDGIPMEVRAMIGLAGPEKGAGMLAPYLTRTPIEVMVDGKPMLMDAGLAPGRTTAKTWIDMRDQANKDRAETRADYNANIRIDPVTGKPMINEDVLRFEAARPSTQLEAARTQGQLENWQSERVNRPIVAVPGAAPAGSPPGTQAPLVARPNTALQEHNDRALAATHAYKNLDTIEADAAKARTGLANVQRLGSLLDQIGTGKFTHTTAEIKAIAQGFGINLTALGITDDVAAVQAANALSSQMALQLRDPSAGAGMPGALSNTDRDYLRGMVPDIGKNPQANQMMVGAMAALYQRKIEEGRIAAAYLQSPAGRANPLGLGAALQDYADRNPIFQPRGAASVTSPMPGADGRTMTATPVPPAPPSRPGTAGGPPIGADARWRQ